MLIMPHVRNDQCLLVIPVIHTVVQRHRPVICTFAISPKDSRENGDLHAWHKTTRATLELLDPLPQVLPSAALSACVLRRHRKVQQTFACVQQRLLGWRAMHTGFSASVPQA